MRLDMRFPRHNNGVADRMSDHTRRSWVCGNMDKMLWRAVLGKETKRQTKRRWAKWNYWHVPRNSWERNNPESFNDGLPKKSRRADFQRNWQSNERNIRLVIAERTKFLETKHHPDETIVQCVHRLKERARYCESERVGTGEMTTCYIW